MIISATALSAFLAGPRIRKISDMAAKPAFRRGAMAAGAIFLLIGIVASIKAEPALLTRLDLGPVLIGLFCAMPATILANACEVFLSAKLIGADMSFGRTLRTSVLGSAANILPIPGAVLVRIAALKASGASLALGASAATFVAALAPCVSLALAGAGLAMLGAGVAAWILTAGGIAMLSLAVGVAVAMSRRSAVVGALVATKTVLTVCDALRLTLCFMALGVDAGVIKCLVLSIGAVIGQAASIVPAGLGVGEGVAVLLAPIVALPAAATFLAVTLSRILVFAAVAPLAGLLSLWTSKRLAAE